MKGDLLYHMLCMYKMIIFDIDGTILDSRAIIKNIKEAYHKFYPTREIDDEAFKMCYFMTPDAAWSYLNIPKDDISAFEDECYGVKCSKLYDLPLCDHIKEVLKALASKGLILAINTSRTKRDLPELDKPFKDIKHYFKDRYFITSDIAKAPKPDPSSLLLLKELSGSKLDEMLFIGDGESDYLCAKRAGVDFALAKWAKIKDIDVDTKYILDDPLEILEIIK